MTTHVTAAGITLQIPPEDLYSLESSSSASNSSASDNKRALREMTTAIIGLLVGIFVAPVVLLLAVIVLIVPFAFTSGFVGGLRKQGPGAVADTLRGLVLLLWFFAAITLLVGLTCAVLARLLGYPTVAEVAESANAWSFWPAALGLPMMPWLNGFRLRNGVDSSEQSRITKRD